MADEPVYELNAEQQAAVDAGLPYSETWEQTQAVIQKQLNPTYSPSVPSMVIDPTLLASMQEGEAEQYLRTHPKVAQAAQAEVDIKGEIVIATPDGAEVRVIQGTPQVVINNKPYDITYDEIGTPAIVGLPAGSLLKTLGGIVPVGTPATPEEQEYVSRDSITTMSPQDINKLRELGVEGFNTAVKNEEYIPVATRELLNNYVRLDNGELVDKQFFENPELTDEQRQFLKVEGIDAFNKEYNQAVDTDTMNSYLRSVGGEPAVTYYKLLQDMDAKTLADTGVAGTEVQKYLDIVQASQERDLKDYIVQVGGDLEHYEGLTPELQQVYIKDLNTTVQQKNETNQMYQTVLQGYVSDGKIKINSDGNYSFAGLSGKDLENPNLTAALQALFPKDAEGNDIDIVSNIEHLYPSYLDNYSQMTDVMKQIAYYNNGIAGLSLFGKTAQEKFETMQAYGLIPIGAKYVGTTDRVIPTDEDLAKWGITAEEWKQITIESGGDFLYGYPVWSISVGRLLPETIALYKTLTFEDIKSKSVEQPILSSGDKAPSPAAITAILDKSYNGRAWNNLSEAERKNVLELYDKPSLYEQYQGGFTDIREWISGEPQPEGQMYVNLTPYAPPDPTTGIAGAEASLTNWAEREDNVGLRVTKSAAAAVANLGLSFVGLLQQAFGAGKQLGAGNFVQAGKSLIGIPVGMTEFLTVQLPQDIIENPAYGAGEVIGLFVLPEVAKVGIKAVKAQMRYVDPKFVQSTAYSTDPNIRFYEGSPYMTGIEFRSTLQDLQQKQRVSPEVSAVQNTIITKIPENIIEGRFTKIGNEYVIDGTRIDSNGNLVGVRDLRYHPAGTPNEPAGMLRDGAKIVVYNIKEDGTREYLVVKDRAGGAYQLAGGDLKVGSSALAQVLDELLHETNLTVKNIQELQPYLGKFTSHNYNGTRIFIGEVVDKTAFDTLKYAGKGIPEVKKYLWLNDNSTARIMSPTWDVLKGIGVKVDDKFKTGIVAASVDRVTDTARDNTWSDRIKEGRLPTEAEIKVAALKDGAITNGQITTVAIKFLTPANMEKPLRLWHFTADYKDLISKTQDGILTLGEKNKWDNVFFTSPEPAARYAIRNIAKEAPLKHNPALIAVDIMPSELIKRGYVVKGVELTDTGGKATGQYVWKVFTHDGVPVIEDEITLMNGTELRVYKPNLSSKVISRGDFKDYTATSVTDNPAPTTTVELAPKIQMYEGRLPSIELSKVKKVVFDLDNTLVDANGKLKPNAINVLEYLKSQDIKVALWTHSPKARATSILNSTGLSRFFDIKDKQSVRVREDYALKLGATGKFEPMTEDTYKSINKVHGDLLIDDNTNQIFEQVRRGNVALKLSSLSEIKDILSGSPTKKIISTRVEYKIPRSVVWEQGQKLPVLYFQTEMFRNAVKEVINAKEISKRLLELDVPNSNQIKYLQYLKKLGLRADESPISVVEQYVLKNRAIKEVARDIAQFKIRPKKVTVGLKGSYDSLFKNISTSLKTEVEGLNKDIYKRQRKAYGELNKEQELRRLAEEKNKLEGMDKTSDEYFKKKGRIEREESYYKEGGEKPYKIGIEDIGYKLAEDIGASSLMESGMDEYAKANAEYGKEMASIKAYEAGISEERQIEEIPIEEMVNETPIEEQTIPELTVPETAIPEVTVPETTIPEITVPETTTPETVVPETVIPEANILEPIIPEPPYQPESPYPPEPPYLPYNPPPPPPVIIKGSGQKLTKEQLLGAIGWKQGIMFKYRYPPWGQNDIINSRTPIQGIPVKEGMRSAYESIIRTMKGTIPPNLVFHMGMMDTVITDADKNGQPEIKFIEREKRKGKGSVATKASLMRL